MEIDNVLLRHSDVRKLLRDILKSDHKIAKLFFYTIFFCIDVRWIFWYVKGTWIDKPHRYIFNSH